MKTWLPIENEVGFGLSHLPYGIFSFEEEKKKIGIRLGQYVIDLAALYSLEYLEGLEFSSDSFETDQLNELMASPKEMLSRLRERIVNLFKEDGSLSVLKEEVGQVLLPISKVKLHLPVQVGDYTDFYSSEQHAYNVGCMFRDPENALMPNWKRLPVGYHGRSSTIVLSEEAIKRPMGQLNDSGKQPELAASRKLDFELEFAYYISKKTTIGEQVNVQEAHEHIFGFSLFNDWSARDIQKWEYVPLGPFLGKSFASTVSPWVTPLEALEPFRVRGKEQDPKPLHYLASSRDWNFDIRLEVFLKTASGHLEKICTSNTKHLYWDVCQQIAHHTINGCKLNTGDMMASGTISGDDDTAYGSMLELCWDGTKPLQLSNGEVRMFLEDGDEIIMKGFAQKGDLSLELGELRTKVLPAFNHTVQNERNSNTTIKTN